MVGSAVEVKGLSKVFRSGGRSFRALDSVSLEIREGEIFGLLGPNGAGKTTLISILCGLLLPDAGSARILGIDAIKNRHSVQQSINVVSGFSSVLEYLSVEDLLNYYALLYSVPDRQKRIGEVLKLVELEDRRSEAADSLSSGLRQRLFLAKALLNRPRVLFLDEPTVGLDVDMAMNIRSFIKRLKGEGCTIVLTTHYMREAEELCDRIALINEGRIVALGTAKELKARVRKEKIIEVITTEVSDLCGKVSKIEGVTRSYYAGDVLRVEVADYKLIRPIARFLLEEGIKIDTVSITEPSLEEVFLKLTKRRLED